MTPEQEHVQPSAPQPARQPAPAPARSKGWVVGRVAGAPVVITPSWFLAAFVLTLLFAPNVQSAAPHLGAGVYVVAFAFVLLLFGSVFLHEAAHALVARARGQQVTELAVTLWGGHTAYTGGLARPFDGFIVAVVGPVTNLVLAAGFWLAYQAQPVLSVPTLLLGAAALSNAFVGVFNLLPGLPLDGGQILESAVWAVTGNRGRGTVVAGWAGRVVAVGVLVWAILWPYLEGRSPGLTTVLWSALLAAFLWSGAGAAIANGRRRAVVGGLSVARLAVPAVTVPLGATVAAATVAAEATGPASGTMVVVTGADGVPLAVVDPDAAAQVPAEAAVRTTVDAVAVPFVPGSAVDAGLSGQAMLARLAATSGGARLVPVTDGGRVTGVLDLTTVARALRGGR